jgi:hypothetical protein
MPNLPTPRCPAAELLAGPPTKGPSVICRVMKLHSERTDSIIEGMVGGVLITDRDHSTVLRGFCCGKGLPRLREDSPPRGHYTFCPVWQAAEQVERERTEANEPIFPMPEKPKILGEDPEVAADLLGLDPEQVMAEEERIEERHRTHHGTEPLRPEITTGVEAMEEVANDPEWKESE